MGKVKSQSVSCSVVSDSLRPHELWPARLLCPWNSAGQTTGVGNHSHSPGDLPKVSLIAGIEPKSPKLQVHSLPSEPPGRPFYFLPIWKN